MRTPASAIAWELGRRHRWGLAAVLATIFILGAIKITVRLTEGQIILRDVTFALLLPIPLASTFLYLLAVFTFGLSGDLAARESMYPARMYALPVSSRALAGWPMLYGCVSVAVWWLAMRAVGLFPRGVDVPVFWPGLFAASLLAWTQALTWMPYPLRGMRIVVSIALLVSIDVVVFSALETRPPESTMLLLLAPFVPLAYLTAWSAVGRARRGEVPEWRVFTPPAREARGQAAPREFASAARAQLWFEWRQFGRSLPVLVALVLPAGLSLLFLFHDVPVIVLEIVVMSLLLPPFLAIFAAATAGKSSANASESYGITPFVATRPIEDRALVAAKWRAALLSAVAAWTVVALALPVALVWSDATEPVLDVLRDVDSALGRPRAIALGVLILAGLIGSTWKQLVQGLYIAMSGRDWAVKGIAFATLVSITIGFIVLGWILDSRQRTAVVFNAIPGVMVTLVAVKLTLAVPVMQRLLARRLWSRAQLIGAAIAWDVGVFALYGVLAWILPEIIFRRYFLLLLAILVVPFVRLAAAPLAVARNRHP